MLPPLAPVVQNSTPGNACTAASPSAVASPNSSASSSKAYATSVRITGCSVVRSCGSNGPSVPPALSSASERATGENAAASGSSATLDTTVYSTRTPPSSASSHDPLSSASRRPATEPATTLVMVTLTGLRTLPGSRALAS